MHVKDRKNMNERCMIIKITKSKSMI